MRSLSPRQETIRFQLGTGPMTWLQSICKLKINILLTLRFCECSKTSVRRGGVFERLTYKGSSLIFSMKLTWGQSDKAKQLSTNRKVYGCSVYALSLSNCFNLIILCDAIFLWLARRRFITWDVPALHIWFSDLLCFSFILLCKYTLYSMHDIPHTFRSQQNFLFQSLNILFEN